ncbi:hypothetical protein [Paenibacillus sp. GXUN7292]|uniref:hypothetical protein n=1 Tax=Paenibacillus sp. GXUN7292 TaxID=3422499 RepID=UPI003D7E4E62
MIGSWRWNVAFGLVGAVLTIIFSLSSNLIDVVLLRSLYAFISFFVVAYAVRLIFAQIVKPPSLTPSLHAKEEDKGAQLDLVTPPQTDDLNDLLKSQLTDTDVQQTEDEKSIKKEQEQQKQAEFKPLNPPQFVSSKNTEPEELAKAIRHLTGE